MMLWLIFATMTLAVLAFLLTPLVRKTHADPQRADYDITVYRDQLTELQRDAERGLLMPDQFESARTEVYRRMLAADSAAKDASNKSESSFLSRWALGLILVICVPLGSGLLYHFLGSPELPAKPYASRQNDPDFKAMQEVETLAAQLQKEPSADGYARLADIYFVLRRYEESVDAYQKAIRAGVNSATAWASLGEAMTMANNSLVVPEARAAFMKALILDTKDPRTRFYLGLAESQINNPRRAVAIWRDLENDSAPDAAWMPMLKEHIDAISKQGNFAAESITPTSVSPKAIDPDAAAGIMAMPKKDQNEVIHQMVERLAAKMKNDPDNMDGWLMLAKSYRVLGETDKAEAAEKKAEELKNKPRSK